MQDFIKENVTISIPNRNSSHQGSEASPLLGSQPKYRFPTISNSMLRNAIDNNFITKEQKELIIRNPNQLTILSAKYNVESPRTSEAMQQLNLEEKDLQVIDYKQCIDNKKEPLHNLVLYLIYISQKYKILSELLRRRNFLKKSQSESAKNSLSKNIKFREEHMMMTEIPLAEDLTVSSIAKKEIFDRKLQKEQQNYCKFINLAASHLSKQDEYYGKTAPQMYQKVELNKQKQIDKVKRKLKRTNMKVEQICQKLKDQEESVYQEHSQVIENIEKRIEDHQERRKKYLMQQDDLMEQLRKREEKDRERQMKRQVSLQIEESMINHVMGQIRKKSDYLHSYLDKKARDEKLRQELSIKVFEEKQQKLQEKQSETEKKKVQEYISKSSQRLEQLQKHEKQMEKQQRVLSLRNSKVMKKIESFQAFQESKQEEMIKKLQEADDRLENGLRRHQSLLDLRKSNISLNNESKLRQVKHRLMEQMLQKMHKQDEVLRKSQDVNKKIEKMRLEQQELERYKKEQLQEQIQQRSLLIHKYSSF